MKAYQVRERIFNFGEILQTWWIRILKGISNIISLQDILTNIAILLGADEVEAAQDMHDVIAFEIELSLVRNINCSWVWSQ